MRLIGLRTDRAGPRAGLPARMRQPALAALLLAAACTAPPPPTPPVTAAPAPDDHSIFASAPPKPFDFTIRGRLVQGGFVFGQAPPGTRALRLDGSPVQLTPDGRFMIGFGRDAPRTAALEATAAGGQRYSATLAITPREWRIERLPTLRQRSSPSPEYEELRQKELARIRAARARTSDALDWQQGFAWPAQGRISGVYGSQRILGGIPASPHYGVDIARPAGWPVAAPAGGIVTLASPPAFSLEGNMVFIDHGHGLSSAFLHLSRVDVREGQRVAQGDIIGAVGSTGRSTGPHLHWGMVWNGVRIDPELLAPPMPAAAPAASAR